MQLRSRTIPSAQASRRTHNAPPAAPCPQVFPTGDRLWAAIRALVLEARRMSHQLLNDARIMANHCQSIQAAIHVAHLFPATATQMGVLRSLDDCNIHHAERARRYAETAEGARETAVRLERLASVQLLLAQKAVVVVVGGGGGGGVEARAPPRDPPGPEVIGLACRTKAAIRDMARLRAEVATGIVQLRRVATLVQNHDTS